MKNILDSMLPLDTQQIMPDVFSIRNEFVNLFLVKSGDKYIALDAGLDNNLTQSTLSDFNIDENDVIAVFLTHTDYDHVSAVNLFSSAEIYMAESNKIFLETERGQSRSKNFVNMKRDYKTLSNDEKITVAGSQIQCIYTPGHTDGSACYIVNGKYLFTGDNMNLKDGKVTLYHTEFNMDDDIQRQSLCELSQLNGIEIIFTMHYGYTGDFQNAFTEFH
jgi:glyoxylase-like metal-dependent hydrolase (beta-lactamase superfamily II)